MTEFLIYQAKTAVALAIFYMFYRLLLSRETFHRFNRIVLLCTAVLSFLLPLCVITITKTVTIHDIPVQVTAPLAEMAGEATAHGTPWWQNAAFAIFVAGACAILVSVSISISRVYSIVRNGRRHMLESGETLIVTDLEISPFSWMKYIVVSNRDYESASSGKDGFNEILTHEKAHIAMGHSWDLLLVDIITVMQWFNPAIWMLKADLRALHEFEADDAVLRSGADIRQYQYLLIRKAVGKSGYSVANSFNHSTLKQRITMMLNKKSPIMSAWKALYIIPLVGISLAATAKTEVRCRYDSPAILQDADSLKGKVTQIAVKKEMKDSVNHTMTIVSNTGGNLLYVVDGKPVDDIESIDASQIKGMTICTGGQLNGIGLDTEGKDGVVFITVNGSTTSGPISVTAPGGKTVSIVGHSDTGEAFSPVYIVDGEKMESIDTIDSNLVVSMDIHKDSETLKKYNAEGKDAVIIIKTKK